MAYQSCHGKPIVGGRVSREPTKTLRDRLITDNLGAQRDQLRAAGVAYIIIHRQHSKLFAWPPGEADISQYLATYPTIYTDSDITILRIE